MAINGGRRTHELHPEQASIIGKKGGLIGGRKGGLIGGRIAIERWAGTPEQKEWSSRGGRDQPREAKVCGGRIGGRIGGPIGSRNQPREAKVCGGRIGGPIGSRITNHLRWHIPYGVYSPTCDLCTNQP